MPTLAFCISMASALVQWQNKIMLQNNVLVLLEIFIQWKCFIALVTLKGIFSFDSQFDCGMQHVYTGFFQCHIKPQRQLRWLMNRTAKCQKWTNAKYSDKPKDKEKYKDTDTAALSVINEPCKMSIVNNCITDSHNSSHYHSHHYSSADSTDSCSDHLPSKGQFYANIQSRHPPIKKVIPIKCQKKVTPPTQLIYCSFTPFGKGTVSCVTQILCSILS